MLTQITFMKDFTVVQSQHHENTMLASLQLLRNDYAAKPKCDPRALAIVDEEIRSCETIC